MTDFNVTFDHDRPIRRRAGVDGLPWSTIRNTGNVHIGGLGAVFFTVVRIFDRRLPRGERVTWEVELCRYWGRSMRTLNGHDEARAAILAAFKKQIEDDNRRMQDEQWEQAFPKASQEPQGSPEKAESEPEVLWVVREPSALWALSYGPCVEPLTPELAHDISRFGIAAFDTTQVERALRNGATLHTISFKYRKATADEVAKELEARQ